MSEDFKVNLGDVLSGLNIEEIVKKSIKDNTTSLNEAYVAEPKTFRQVSELVSQKTKESHVALYKGYVESLNKTSAQLDSVDKLDVNSSHSQFRSLKLDETYNLNATWLHELYFANCFDPRSEVHMDSMSFLRIERDFGTFDDWQKDFIACAMSAGEGWVVCGYNIFLKRYVNTFVSHHSGDVMVGLLPVLVVDMWAHSYHRDYLNDKKSYLVNQMREINWTVVEERVKKMESVHEVFK